MHLSGSAEDFRRILKAASEVEAASIYFIFPNIVFILSHNKQDYIFVKTTINVGTSVMVPKSGYLNMRLYFNQMKKNTQSALVTDSSIYWNESKHQKMDVCLPFFRIKKEVEFNLKEKIYSSYDLDSPYLRIPNTEIKKLKREWKTCKRLHRLDSHTTIRVEGGQLVLLTHNGKEKIRSETNISAFASHPDYSEKAYAFGDHAFYLFWRLMKITTVEEIIFLPRSNYGIIEGYSDEMVLKVRSGAIEEEWRGVDEYGLASS